MIEQDRRAPPTVVQTPRAVPLWIPVLGCVALAAASLRLPAWLTYDPWAWMVWGRQVAGLDLVTAGGGPAWKPLPVAVAAGVSALGAAHLAPAVWLVVARGGGLLALALAYRLAARLAGPLAGILAAVLVVSSTGYVDLWLSGMSEPLLCALVLLAAERHLAGQRAAAVLAAGAAAMLRPETWPFLLGYGVLLSVQSPRRTRVLAGLAGLAALLALVWFGAELWGSGDPLRSSHRAALPTEGGPLLTAEPGRAVLELTRDYLVAPGWIGILIAAVLVALRVAGRRTAALLALGVAWIAVVAVMTQLGASPGEQRYLIVGIALLAVCAGVGWHQLLALAVGRLPTGTRRSWAAFGCPAAAALVAALLVATRWSPGRPEDPASDWRIRWEETRAAYIQRAQEGAATEALSEAVRQAGGRAAVTACRTVLTGPYEVPALAWVLDIPLQDVVYDRAGPGVALRSRHDPAGRPAVPPGYRPIPLTGPAAEHWEAFSGCPQR